MYLLQIGILLLLFVAGNDGQANRVPDLTLLTQQNNGKYNITCVAGNDLWNSAIALITPLRFETPKIACTHNRTLDFGLETRNNFMLLSSFEFTLMPITDPRWEEFEIHYTDGRWKNYDIKPNSKTYFNVGLSLRTAGQAAILLCGEKYNKLKSNYNNCYLVIKNNPAVASLYECRTYSIITTLNLTPCTKLGEKSFNRLNENEWEHFLISRDTKNETVFMEMQNFDSFSGKNDYATLDVQSIFFYSNGPAAWKIHDYNFISIKVSEKSIHITRKKTENKFICLSMSVALCSQCSIKLTIEDEQANEKNILINSTSVQNEDFLKWQDVQIKMHSTTSDVTLYALAEVKDSSPGFWGIDNIRRCYKNGRIINRAEMVRSLSYELTTMHSIQDFSCQALQFPEYKVQRTDSLDENVIPCPENKYINSNCSITCKSVTGTEYCDKHVICRLMATGQTKCTCAAGYTGYPYCKKECDNGYYGHNCIETCGECNSGSSQCNKNSGKCAEGCADGYKQEEFCKELLYPRLRQAPKVVYIGSTTITIFLDDKRYDGAEIPTLFRIQYKLADANNWTPYSTFLPLKESTNVTITKLKILQEYHIRAILYNSYNGNFTSVKVPYVTAVTKCEDISKLVYDIESRQVYITRTENEIECPSHYYKVYLTDEQNKIINLPDNSFNLPKKIFGLNPFTTYTITLFNKQLKTSPKIINPLFETKQDAPSEVLNIKYETTSSSINATWSQPQFPNGIINEYKVIYEVIQHRCPLNKNYNKMKLTARSYSASVLLQELKPYTLYNVTFMAVTIKEGYPVSIQIETQATETAEDDELPTNISIDENASDAILNWMPLECDKRRGSLNYIMHVKCNGNIWCKEKLIQPIDAYKGIYNIKDLIPYTNYTLYLSATRVGSKKFTNNLTLHFMTSAGVPPPVSKLAVYSRSETVLSLRWAAPYPPYGELQEYKVKYCNVYNKYCIESTVLVNNVKLCELWIEMVCFEITQNLQSKTEYTVQVLSKNKNVQSLNSSALLETKTEEIPSEAPRNLNFTWLNNKMMIHWSQPDITNGPLIYFQVELNQTSTELQSEQNQSIYVRTLNVTKQKIYYKYKVEKNIPYSSSYNVRVFGVNKYIGSYAEIKINTPPETPELIKLEISKPIAVSKTTLSVIIPSVDPKTKSKENFMYIVVINVTSTTNKLNHPLERENKSFELELLKKIENLNSSAWVAVELKPNGTESSLIIGDDTLTPSAAEKGITFLNRQLHVEKDSYDLYIILMNQYSKERSYKVYKAPTFVPDVSNNAGLYALLLLLLVPFIVWFVYKRIWNKKPLSTNQAIVSTTEAIPEPDMILVPTKSMNAKKEVHKNLNYSDTVPLIPNTNIAEETKVLHSRLVTVEHFEEYVKKAFKSEELEEQHKLFPRGQTKPWDYGTQIQNKFKNRYANLAAYDHNRVKLRKINDDFYSDYINASFINGYKKTRTYIATQGPKLSTINDFWRMIWQEKVQYIVMLANLTEGGKRKCDRYWPDKETSKEFGNIEVTYVKSDIYADFKYRTFTIQFEGVNRKVEQLHFTSWPDHGVPLYPQLLVPFLKRMHAITNGCSPVVVHCSAGVGRTGTIILSDICLRMAKKEGSVDVLKYLHELRNQRMNLVDNVQQYKLVHMVLLECLLAPETNISCINFPHTLKKLSSDGTIQTEFNFLKSSHWPDERYCNGQEANIENESKSRFKTIVPGSQNIYISCDSTGENSNYINAVPVDGFRFKDQFIATQLPMPNTIQDFWAMIRERSVRVIVSLNDIPLMDKTCCQFWPTYEQEMRTTRGLALKFVSAASYESYNIISVQYWDANMQDDTIHIVQIIQFKGWKFDENLPKSAVDLITFSEEIEALSRGKHPIVVTCYDGTTACGIYIALSFIIEKIKLEQQVDICLAVRVIRRNRIQFVSKEEQYKFLFKAAEAYLNMFENYSNFEIPK